MISFIIEVNLGENCTTDAMCKYDGAKCGNDKKCVCLDNTYVEGEACKESKSRDESKKGLSVYN